MKNIKFMIQNMTKDITRENILDGVVFRVINTETNKGLLNEAVYFKFFDLAVIYTLPVWEDKTDTMDMLISRSIIEDFNISFQVLQDAAFDNTRKYYDFTVKDTKEIMTELGVSAWMMDADPVQMYVCTSKIIRNGATILLYPEYFAKIADENKCDLFIIPSSINEVLAIPANTVDDPKDLKDMCRMVNTEEVELKEQLGNTIYKYNRENRQLEIAC